MVWDGECDFCRRWIERWQRWTGGKIEFETYQQVGSRYAPLGPDEYRQAVFLIESDGKITRAAEAVFRSLWMAGSFQWPYNLYRSMPWFERASELVYRWVARNRDRLVRWGF